MPLLDIAISQASLQHHLGPPRASSIVRCKVPPCPFAVGDARRREPSWGSFQFPSKVRVHRKSWLMVRAVATLEPKSFSGKGVLDNVDAENGSVKVKSLWEDSEELDAKEKIRRMRISKANRGLTPWNKGRKHSPETIQRIKERTKLAMQDPKIKMKLNSHGHSHREETKINISQGLRTRWQKRREKQLNQETCYYEWQNLISDASRNGYTGEEELQWNSNQILTEKIAVGDERRQRPSCEGFQKCRLVVKVVPNLEPNCSPGSEAPTVSCKELMYNDDTDNGSVEVKSKGKDWEELDEKERLRRMRISKANKGNTPWNAGRKHRPETIQRIKEGTRLAMQDPEIKFKMNISKFGHTQSEETKLKIAAGQRKRWQKYHKTLRCVYEWQNLIAEASRNGYGGQEELQWDSYQILSKKLAADWAQSDKLRPMPRQQRKKIGKAMGAKWADPVYRERVLSAVARFYERSERDPRKPGEKPSDGVQTRKKASSEQKTNST